MMAQVCSNNGCDKLQLKTFQSAGHNCHPKTCKSLEHAKWWHIHMFRASAPQHMILASNPFIHTWRIFFPFFWLVLPTLPIAALRKSFQTIEFFFSPAFQPRLQILREALVFLKEETAWKLVDINYLHPSQKKTHDDLKTLNPAMNVIIEQSCVFQRMSYFSPASTCLT